MRRFSILSAISLATILTVVQATVVAAQENYGTAWSRHRNVFLNTTASGAGVTGTVLNFPVLVRLGTADSATFAQARAGGVDIRFTKADNATRLPHQIDHWDATGRTAAVWVRVDSVKGSNSTQMIRMHWGNATAADSSNGTAVFANGFTNVWHLGNAAGVAARPNAIAGGNPATPTNFPGGYAAPRGLIGMGDTLRGGDGSGGVAPTLDLLNLGSITTDYSQGLTFSTWIYQTVLGTNTIYYSGSFTPDGTATGGLVLTGLQGVEEGVGAKFRQRNGTTGGNSGIILTDGAMAGVLGRWAHTLFTLNSAGEMSIYLDGNLIGSASGIAMFSSASRPVNQLGSTLAHMNYSDYSFSGILDEARLANVGRTADWARLEYQNQRPAQVLAHFDSVPVSVARAHNPVRSADFSVRVSGGSVSFQLDGANPNGARLTVVDMNGRAVWRGIMAQGANQLVWNYRDGRASTGHLPTAGVYLVRITLLDKQGLATRAAERKLLLAP